MAVPLSVNNPALTDMAVIRIFGPNEFDVRRELPSGDALVIGCSPACGIRLEGWGIAGMHCTISLENGQITIDDWDTEGGTYVGGKRVARQLVVDPGAELKIGDYRITTALSKSSLCDLETPCEPDVPCESNVSCEPATPGECEGAGATEVAAPFSALHEMPAEDVSVQDDAWDSPFDEIDSVDDTPAALETGYARDAFDAESHELLQMEIEFLRTELAQRDARLGELEGLRSQGVREQDDDLPSREEVEALASRLENLLDELEHSDERLKTMTELLRMSDDANVAAQEERAQMESWIGEVERRVRQWEEEWHAERENMNKSIAELTAQRDRAEAQRGASGQAELVHELRVETVDLRSQLKKLEAERNALSQRMETSETRTTEERVQAAIDEALREERLQLSQAKAECARERAKLAQQQEQLTFQEVASRSEPDAADLRIRAFREHLKEIRATEPSGRPAPSMSQRLGKLWRKMEGRPLDTD